MTPESGAQLAARWVRFYTRELPTAIAQRRVREIDADVHDHIAYERSRGTSDRRIAFDILSRMVRGLTADVSWRWSQPLRGDRMKSLAAILATAFGVAAIGVVGVVAIMYGEADDAPGLMLLGVLLIVGAFALAVRAAQRTLTADVSWRRSHPLSGDPMKSFVAILATALSVAAIGVVAIMYGEADDAPGLMLLGVLLIVGAFALGVRTAQRTRSHRQPPRIEAAGAREGR